MADGGRAVLVEGEEHTTDVRRGLSRQWRYSRGWVGRVYVGDLAPRRVGDNSQARVGEEASEMGDEGRLGAKVQRPRQGRLRIARVQLIFGDWDADISM